MNMLKLTQNVDAGKDRLDHKLTLSEARKKYEELKLQDLRYANEFALSMIPIFASNQFFYAKTLSNRASIDIRARAASVALKYSESGIKIDFKILVRSARIISRIPESHCLRQDLTPLNVKEKIEGELKILAEIYEAKLERRWDDAYDKLAQYVEDYPHDVKRRLELGLLAYRSGAWGERIASIRALCDYPKVEKAQEAYKAVACFFQACSVPLDSPTNANKDLGLKSPASVFQHVLTTCPVAQSENRKGIVMISPSLAGGGAERIAATICQGLLKKGKSIEMAVYEDGGRSGRNPLFYLPITGLHKEEIHILELQRPLQEPFNWLPPNLSRKSQAIYELLKVRRPHTLYLTLDMANLAGGFAGLIAGVPNIILHCHNHRPSDIYGGLGMDGWAAAYRALLQRDEIRMIAVSQSVADDYVDWIGIPSSRIEVVRNGLRLNQLMKPDRAFLTKRRFDLGIPRASLVVGTAIRFEEVKQPDLWLRMAQRVAAANQSVHFVLFGEGVLLDAARLICRNLEIEKRVHFTGHVNDLYRQLSLLDVFVLSSRSEGLPNVLLEAQAAGAIPVAFDVGGCRETMIDGITGYLVREKSDNALANAVLRALDEPEWRRRAKKEGRKFVRTQFSVGRMINSFNRLLGGVQIRS